MDGYGGGGGKFCDSSQSDIADRPRHIETNCPSDDRDFVGGICGIIMSPKVPIPVGDASRCLIRRSLGPLEQCRRQDLARGEAQNDMEIT